MLREDHLTETAYAKDNGKALGRNDVQKSENTTLAQILIPSSREYEDAELVEGDLNRTGTFASSFSSIRRRFCGWKGGLTISATADITVLLIVLSLTFAAAFAYPRDGNNAILIDGDCSRTKTSQTLLHLLINILSTILLSTSSYAMQCLGSPTRAEVERAHARGKAMNIGVPSFTNLFRVRKGRLACYIALMLTSLPIHLLANSTVFETIGANSYLLVGAYEKFLTTPLEDLSQAYSYFVTGYHSMETISTADGVTAGSPLNQISLGWNTTSLLKGLQNKMERLDRKQCIDAYADPFSPTRKNVIAVLDEPSPSYNNSNFITMVYYQSVDFCPECRTFENWTDPAIWTCAFTTSEPSAAHICDTRKASSQADSFAIDGVPISYCLSEPAEESCRLEANIPILAVVVVCAFFKIIILYVSLRTLPSGILATIGDAVASFLDCPDSRTTECSLLEKTDIRHNRWKPCHPFPKPWRPSIMSAKWREGPSAMVWARTIIFMIAILVVAVALFGLGVKKFTDMGSEVNSDEAIAKSIGTPRLNGAFLMQMGFGTVNVNLLLSLADMSSQTDVVGHILLVNTPQLILSLIYFTYNTCWTNMLVAREWAKFGRERKSLRTSTPVGSQRHTYFLTIPYKFAIPLQLCSALLHWLLSQSFFLARVNVYSATPFVERAPAVINTAGYSLIALLFFMILWAVMFIVLAVFGAFGKLKSPMPIVGGSSIAISAACHPPQTDVHPSLKPVMWGVIDTMEHEDGIKHCAFTSEDVYSPETLDRRERNGGFSTKISETQVLFA